MATVTSALTRISDVEGALTTANLPSGGGGAGANTDIFLQGAQSLGKRTTNTADTGGFMLIDAADNNLSAASVHIGIWFWVTQYGILDDLRLICATGVGTPTNYDSHTFPFATEYPPLGGWVRGWIDISRTPDLTVGTGLNEAALRSYGIQVSFSSSPGGTSPNVILDAADFTNGGAALTLAGVSGLWTDFTTADENSTNQYGVVRRVGGVFNCLARVQLGTASSLVFTDSSFTIVFPQQALVETTFMGVTCDLQNASTIITLTAGSFISPGSTRKGDFVVTGTSGDLIMDQCVFNALRILTFTAGCVVTNCSFSLCGAMTLGGATLDGCTIANNTAAIALACANTPGNVTNTTFISDGTGHAIEITGAAGSFSLTGLVFTGYAGSNGSTGNESVYVNIAAGSVTLNITDGGTPTYRTAGATVTIVSTITITLTGLKNPTEVRVFTAGTTTELAGTGAENVTDGDHAFSVSSGVSVDISILSLGYQNTRILAFSSLTNATIPVSQVIDRQYLNP